MHEPIRRAAAAIADQALAIDPVATPVGVLDAVIVAQPCIRGGTPPFGRDPFWPFDAGDVVNRLAPHEAPRHALGSGIDDCDRFRTVEQALRTGWRRRQFDWRDFLLGGPPSTRLLRQMAFVGLWAAHRAGTELHRQSVDQPRNLALAIGFIDQALLRRAQVLAPFCGERESIETELRVERRGLVAEQALEVLWIAARDRGGDTCGDTAPLH